MVVFFIIAQVMPPCWNLSFKHGSLSWNQGFSPKRRPLPQNWYRTHRKTQPGREMLNKDLKTFCWTRSRKAPSKHSSAKLSWLWRQIPPIFSLANLWKDYNLFIRSPNRIKKVHPSHQTSFPIWTPPWHRVRSKVCEGGNVGNRNGGPTSCEH